MDKSKIETKQVNNKDRELKGLKNNGIIVFECADCGEKLLCLQLTSTENDGKVKVITRVVVRCCICDGYSYVKEVPGQFYPGAPSDNMAFDVSDIEDGCPEADVVFKAWKK